MNKNIISKQILKIINSVRGKTKWMKEVEEDLKQAYITINDAEIRNSGTLSKNIHLTAQHR